MGTLYDPDIQDAPVYPVLFEVLQDNQPTQIVDPDKEFTFKCSVYVPRKMRQALSQYKYYVYVTLIVNEVPIAQKVGLIPASNQRKKVLQFAVQFERFNKSIESNKVNLQMAITAKHNGESGMGESLRIGRFVNTFIPLEKEHE